MLRWLKDRLYPSEPKVTWIEDDPALEDSREYWLQIAKYLNERKQVNDALYGSRLTPQMKLGEDGSLKREKR